MRKKVDLTGVQIDCGASKLGACIGPYAIRIAGLAEGIRKLGCELNDKGDIVQPCGGGDSPTLLQLRVGRADVQGAVRIHYGIVSKRCVSHRNRR